jgi:hypothetical protein
MNLNSTRGVSKRGILLIGFNRPTLFRERLNEIKSFDNQDTKIIISIDGPRENNPQDPISVATIVEEIKNTKFSADVEIWISDTNQGCDLHIYKAITKAFNICDYLAVIEDDIEVSSTSIAEMLNIAELQMENFKESPVIAMSGLFWKIPWIENSWRKSYFFSAWGYVLSKNFWELHTRRVEENPGIMDLGILESNEIWASMSTRRKFIWNERMGRKNYDYSIQRTLFEYQIPTIAPKYRMINNLGHGISSASHTRFRSPWYLRKSVEFGKASIQKNRQERIKNNKILIWLDSQTWAGDGLLSVRGRTSGVRTYLKRILRNIVNR